MEKLLHLLPASLPLMRKLAPEDEGFVDLGESLIPKQLTPADRLMARFRKHTRTPTAQTHAGPIEYTVVTKVLDADQGISQLNVETVVHTVDKPAETGTGGHGRLSWKKHREQLKDTMRTRRLEQYEARIKEQGGIRTTCTPTRKKNEGLSDDDTEWSAGDAEDEGEDDESTASEGSTDDSSSSSDADEEQQNDEDAEDAVVGSSARHRSCMFADDEAEEGSDEEAAEILESKHDCGDSDDERSRDSASSRGKHESRRHERNQLSVLSHGGKSPKTGFSKFDLLLDDYTDLPSQPPVTTSYKSPMTNNYRLNSTMRRPQGSLGPGDVDLFMSDYSTVLDRTANTTSLLASTRLDATTVGGDQRKNLSRDGSAYSQWNDTPYELLYSQKPMSQRSSLTKDPDSTSMELQLSVAEPCGNVASQDTVLLSQASSRDLGSQSTLLNLLPSGSSEQQLTQLDPSCSNYSTTKAQDFPSQTQESQNQHSKRRLLFSDSIAIDDGEVVETEPLPTSDTQSEHSQRRQLFASTATQSKDEAADTQCDDSQRRQLFASSATQPEDQATETQSEHSQRRQLFASSCTQSENQSTDTQNEHSQRRELFASSATQPAEPAIDTQSEQHSQRRALFASSVSQMESQSAVDDFAQEATPSKTPEQCTTTNEVDFNDVPTQSLDSQLNHAKRSALFTDLSCPTAERESTGQPNDDNISMSLFSTNVSQSNQLDGTTNESDFVADSILPPDPVADKVECKLPRRRVMVEDDDDDDSAQSPLKPNLAKLKLLQQSLSSLKAKLNKPIKLDPDSKTCCSPHESEDDERADEKKALEIDSGDDEEDGKSQTDESADDSIQDTDDGDQSDGKSNNYESQDEEEVQRLAFTQDPPKKKKKFRMRNFVDEEAELSGDENERAYYMDDDNERVGDVDLDDDDLEELLVDDAELPSAGKLRRQVERVHQRLQVDQDQRELRFLKELYFEDGDLHAEDGRVRERRFRWRGLENDDPMLNMQDDDAMDGDDDDDDETEHKLPFGAMDRWLKGGVASQAAATADRADVDLDTSASVANGDGVDDGNASDGTEHVASEPEEDEGEGGEEEKENAGVANSRDPLSVFSLGRKAFMKTKAQSQIVVMSVNKKVSVTKTADKTSTTVVSSTKSTTLKNFFSVQPTSKPILTGPILPGTSMLRSESAHAFPVPVVPSVDLRSTRFNKRGSLLGRVPAVGRVNSLDTDVVLIKDGDDEDSASSSSSSSQSNRNQAHFLGLRNKIGLSCFNVLSQPAKLGASAPTGFDSSKRRTGEGSQPTQGGSKSMAHPVVLKQKRPSTGSTPPNVKRPRPSSVFTVLM